MTPIHILLVGDNEGDILLTLEALHEGNLPLEVSVVKDGFEALQFIAQEGSYLYAKSPHLILLDADLRKINGHQVLERLKIGEKGEHIPVVMLTSSKSEKSDNYQNNADCYVQKPINADDFKRVSDSIESFWINFHSKDGLK